MHILSWDDNIIELENQLFTNRPAGAAQFHLIEKSLKGDHAGKIAKVYTYENAPGEDLVSNLREIFYHRLQEGDGIIPCTDSNIGLLKHDDGRSEPCIFLVLCQGSCDYLAYSTGAATNARPANESDLALMLKGLEGLHGRNVNHRDVAARNIFYYKNSWVLGDLGFAGPDDARLSSVVTRVRGRVQTHAGDDIKNLALAIIDPEERINLMLDLGAQRDLVKEALDKLVNMTANGKRVLWAMIFESDVASGLLKRLNVAGPRHSAHAQRSLHDLSLARRLVSDQASELRGATAVLAAGIIHRDLERLETLVSDGQAKVDVQESLVAYSGLVLRECCEAWAVSIDQVSSFWLDGHQSGTLDIVDYVGYQRGKPVHRLFVFHTSSDLSDYQSLLLQHAVNYGSQHESAQGHVYVTTHSHYESLFRTCMKDPANMLKFDFAIARMSDADPTNPYADAKYGEHVEIVFRKHTISLDVHAFAFSRLVEAEKVKDLFKELEKKATPWSDALQSGTSSSVLVIDERFRPSNLAEVNTVWQSMIRSEP
ncbi:MAG: hypothetical protein ABL949_01380 [Fimbriimonadaceae bacterium]